MMSNNENCVIYSLARTLSRPQQPTLAPWAYILFYHIIGFIAANIGDPAVVFHAANFIKSRYVL